MAARLWKHMRLYPRFLAQALKQNLEYDLGFALNLGAAICTHLTAIVFIGVLFRHIPELQGWTAWEVAFIYGLAALPRALANILFNNAWSLSGYIPRGELDRLLVRPISPLFQLLTGRVGVQGFGHLAVGLVMAGTAWGKLRLPLTPARVGFLLLAVVSGAVIYVSVVLACSAISFWIGGGPSSLSYMVYQLGEFAGYPVTIYGGLIQTIITWVIPFAFAAFVPAAYLLSKPGWTHLARLTPAMALISAGVACGMWHLGLRQYTSTGT